MNLLLSVAFGGAMGAVGRYLVAGQMLRLMGPNYPWGTLAVNVIGSFAMGALVEVMALKWSPSPEMRSFLTIGGLGAFTTFSTFSLDVAVMVERGDMTSAGLYVLASVALSVGGLFAGLSVMRMFLA